MSKSVNIVTLGCSKNLVDSERLMKQLHANNIALFHDSNEPTDTVIINTCGFIESAKEESINTILNFVQAKNSGLIKSLYVIGCLSERYKDELKKEITEVDEYFGTNDLKKILQKLDLEYKTELLNERFTTTPTHLAYLKISEGCDRKCSYCAIPKIRGAHISVPKEQLVMQAKFLVSQGAKELALIAQDLSFYGVDLYNKRELPDLVRMLADESGAEWIRLHYTYPTDFPYDILKVMKERSNVCNYLDMPIQHISNNMLKKMRRYTTKERTVQLLNDIKQAIPDIALRTTLLVGHPGETKDDFNELTEFVQNTRFDRLGVFTYSHEEGTHSYTFDDDVSPEEKDERAEKIMEIQAEISRFANERRIGNTYKVLIDRKEDNFFVGRTQYDSFEVDNEVIINEEGLSIGGFYNVKINSADEYDIVGSVVK